MNLWRVCIVTTASSALLLMTLIGAGTAYARDDKRARGAVVFEQYCVVCHGVTGKGDGRAAAVQQIRPADLTASKKDDAYKRRIIREGGAAMQRSGSMPPWRDALSQRQIDDVVTYLRVLANRGSIAKSSNNAARMYTEASP